MKNNLNKFLIACFAGVILSCESEVVDFTEVVNPNLTESAVAGQTNSSIALLGGIKRQMSLLSNEYVTISEIASDNYTNSQTFYNQFLDNLNIDFQDTDMNNFQFDIARLRELTDFGLETIGPADPSYVKETEAEYHFYKGISFMLAGEYFSVLPVEAGGVPLSSIDNFALAIAEFEAANVLVSNAKYYAAIARVNYRLGNKSAAVSAAETALSMDVDFLFTADFDETNGPSSEIEDALFERGNFDDLQPLPSLDFLDPKYSFKNTTEDMSVAILKAEESYFIIAEAQASDNDIAGVKGTLTNLLTLIDSREVVSFDDSVDDRMNSNGTQRPNNSSVVVKYDGDASFMSDLVLDRVDVSLSNISGTSVTASDIDALAFQDEALELIYKMRQEVFIAEGMRVLDLGIKYVVSEIETQLNENINAGDFGTVVDLPSFIESVKLEMDAFNYDEVSGEVIIKHNLTKILVANKTSDRVLPFN